MPRYLNNDNYSDEDFIQDHYESRLLTIRLDSQLSVKLMTAVLRRYGHTPEPRSSRRRYSIQVLISERDYEREIKPAYEALSGRLWPIFNRAIDTVAERLGDEDRLSDEDLYKLVFEKN